MKMASRLLALGAFFVVLAFLATPPSAGKPPEGKGGGNGGGKGKDKDVETSGAEFEIELVQTSGKIVDFNDNADMLVETEFYDGSTYYLSTIDSGERTVDEIKIPAGWTSVELVAMNNFRQLVGTATYDPDGDGVDADGDGALDEGDIFAAGVRLSPDSDGDGVWELDVIFPGPLSGMCHQINNNGDIVGQDDSSDGYWLMPSEGAPEPFPIRPFGIGVGNTLSDRDSEGHLAAVSSGKYYLPRKYDTSTGSVTVLPTFERATFVNASAFTINALGEAVGQADTYPAYWSPKGEISRIPGWSKSKNATGHAFCINEFGEIVISSNSEGPHLYSPDDGLVPLTSALTNPEVIPDGYQLWRVSYINNFTEIAGQLRSDTGEMIPCVLYPVDQP